MLDAPGGEVGAARCQCEKVESFAKICLLLITIFSVELVLVGTSKAVLTSTLNSYIMYASSEISVLQ
jgi:hypothetical protein